MTDNRPQRNKRLGPDLSPLRQSRDYRLLFTASTVSLFGSAFPLLVAIPLQVKRLTGEPLAVAAIGAVELVPMLTFALWGGVLADRVDRRRLVLASEAGLALLSVLLLGNVLLPHPMLWPLYVAAGGAAALQSVQWPATGAMLPRLVPHELLPAALTLESLRGNAVVVLGPSLGGVLAATAGLRTVYVVDLATFAVSLALLGRLRAVPPEKADQEDTKGVREGIRYAVSRPELIGTYLMDVAATVLAIPTVLLVFLADELHSAWSLGMMYAATAVGGLLVGVTGGWIGRVHRHGRLVIAGALGWGLAIVGAGFAPTVWLVLPALVVAGAGNVVADTFRATIWGQSIPDRLRGRLAGIELLSGEIGPALGQLRAGAVAARWGVRLAIWSGGLASVITVGGLTAALRGLWRYDDRTDPHVAAVREEAAKAG